MTTMHFLLNRFSLRGMGCDEFKYLFVLKIKMLNIFIIRILFLYMTFYVRFDE